MSDKQLIEVLQEIRRLVDSALKESPSKRAAAVKTAGKSIASINGRPGSLPEHILALRDKRFFAQPKTYNEVHAKLQESYPCDVERVKVACIRLQKRKQLRKASKVVGNRNQVAYAW